MKSRSFQGLKPESVLPHAFVSCDFGRRSPPHFLRLVEAANRFVTHEIMEKGGRGGDEGGERNRQECS